MSQTKQLNRYNTIPEDSETRRFTQEIEDIESSLYACRKQIDEIEAHALQIHEKTMTQLALEIKDRDQPPSQDEQEELYKKIYQKVSEQILTPEQQNSLAHEVSISDDEAEATGVVQQASSDDIQ